MAAPSVTHTLVNTETSDATEVNTNFSDVKNGITDGTKDLTISALTCGGIVTMNGDVTIGNASADTSVVNALVNSDLNPEDASGAYTLGDTSNQWTALYLDNDATDGGAVYFNGAATAFLKSDAAGAIAEFSGFTSVNGSGLDLGDTSNPWKSIILDNGATDGGALYFNTATAAFIKSNADGDELSYGAFKNGVHAMCKFDGTGTPSIGKSVNVASITDNGTGDYTLNFTTNAADIQYVTVATGGARELRTIMEAVGSMRVGASDSGGVSEDDARTNVLIMGNR